MGSAAASFVNLTTTFNHVHQRLSTAATNSTYQFAPTLGSTAYGAVNGDDTYPTVAAVNFTYDGNRNLTFDGTNTLTYDAENRLIQAVKGTVTSTYLYNPLGHRKQKKVGGTVTTMILDGDDEIADYTGATPKPKTLTVRGAGGEPVASVTPATNTKAEAVQFYHLDGIGSAIATSQAGKAAAADHFDYGPFGEPDNAAGLVYRFAGTRLDAESGFYYARARMYDPAIGRFLQADPIGLKGGTNLYAYVGDDPINLTDPSGLWVLQFGLNVGGGGAGIVGGYEVGIAIDSQGHIGIYDTATFGAGVGVEAGASASLSVNPHLDSITQLNGPGAGTTVTAGEGVQYGFTYAHGLDGPGTESYGISLGFGAGVSAASGFSSTHVSCFDCSSQSLSGGK